MHKPIICKTITCSRLIGFSIALLAAASCDAGRASLDGLGSGESLGSKEQAITDVAHTPVENQSIGNCWLYAQATWVESMSLSADPTEPLDLSQSYWTYWHWFDQVTSPVPPAQIQTGGSQFTAHAITRDRGLMLESAFVPEDSDHEHSARQASALAKVNEALARGDFARASGLEIRQIFDDAWELSPAVRAQLDQAFGEDGEATLRQGADLEGTDIVDPALVQVQYTENVDGDTQTQDANLLDAIGSWHEVRYPAHPSARRAFLRRVQLALHDRQPVVITWDVDFNALENQAGERQGSFNLQTLQEAGAPGSQGGHMTVLEDYQAQTVEFGLLEAGVTLDGTDPVDAEKLEAALLDSSTIQFLRVKNSWGTMRPDSEFAQGFPGYHDLWMDYLDGPIPFCPDAVDPTNESCDGESIPLWAVLLPPGY
jgi:hypothetical protein